MGSRKLRVGDRIRIDKAAPGAFGANGREGVVTDDPLTNGISGDPLILRVRTDDGAVWAVGQEDQIQYTPISVDPTSMAPPSIAQGQLKIYDEATKAWITVDLSKDEFNAFAAGLNPVSKSPTDIPDYYEADEDDDDDLSVPAEVAPERRFPGPQEQKPMVTRAEYNRAKAVLDSLEPGVYVKCSDCRSWQHGGTFTVHAGGSRYVCEACRG